MKPIEKLNKGRTYQDIQDITLKSPWDEVILNYKIDSKIGEGTFGKVYKAQHIRTGRKVAIKHIFDNLNKSHRYIAIIREIQLMRKLQDQSNCFTPKLLEVMIPTDEILAQ